MLPYVRRNTPKKKNEVENEIIAASPTRLSRTEKQLKDENIHLSNQVAFLKVEIEEKNTLISNQERELVRGNNEQIARIAKLETDRKFLLEKEKMLSLEKEALQKDLLKLRQQMSQNSLAHQNEVKLYENEIRELRDKRPITVIDNHTEYENIINRLQLALKERDNEVIALKNQLCSIERPAPISYTSFADYADTFKNMEMENAKLKEENSRMKCSIKNTEVLMEKIKSLELKLRDFDKICEKIFQLESANAELKEENRKLLDAPAQSELSKLRLDLAMMKDSFANYKDLVLDKHRALMRKVQNNLNLDSTNLFSFYRGSSEKSPL